MADIQALVTNNKSTRNCFSNGILLPHVIINGTTTTGKHEYLNGQDLKYNETTLANISFLNPSNYPNTIYIGMRISLTNGIHEIGYAVVTEIYNELLKIK